MTTVDSRQQGSRHVGVRHMYMHTRRTPDSGRNDAVGVGAHDEVLVSVVALGPALVLVLVWVLVSFSVGQVMISVVVHVVTVVL